MTFPPITWLEDRALIGDLVFRLEQARNDAWDLGDNCFRFYKAKSYIDTYEKLLKDFRPKHILELGMWDGGSIAFWNEVLRPSKIAGVDLWRRFQSKYFDDYVAKHPNVLPYWNTDQTDTAALARILEDLGGLDLVIDDCSHLYAPTKASFEFLFPLLPEGGLYVIEDWAWAHWPDWQDPKHSWAKETAMSKLILELVELTGSTHNIIKNIEITRHFAAIKRGSEALPAFKIENHIVRRPKKWLRLLP